MGDPFGEGETVVSCKSEGLTCSRSVPRDVCCDDDEENENRKCSNSLVGHCGLENIDERISGWVIECVVHRLDGE